MRISVSSLALLVTGTSAATVASANSDNSNLAINHVRSLGMQALRKAHSHAQAVRRRLQESEDDLESLLGMFGGEDGDDMFGGMFGGEDGDDMFGGMMDLFGGEGEGDMFGGMMDMISPDMICAFLPLVTSEQGEDLTDLMEAIGMSCSKFGCDDDNSHLIMNCDIAGEFCSGDDPFADLQRRRLGAPEEVDEEFCSKDISVEMSVALDFHDKIEIFTNNCCTYTKPDYMANMGPGCLSTTMDIDFVGLMEEMMGDIGNFSDPTDMTPEEAAAEAKKLLQYYSFKECKGDFDGGAVTCDCGLCDDGMGFELSCSNGIHTESCNDFNTDIVDQFSSGALLGDTTNNVKPPISVVRFAMAP